MKKKDTVLLLGVFSILILIASQIINLARLWKQNDELLKLRYRTLSQEAERSLRGQRTFAYDTVSRLLDDYSKKIIPELRAIKDTAKLAEKKKDILAYVNILLNKEQDFSTVLSSYFDEMGFEKDFNHIIKILNFELIDKDTIHIYRDSTFMRRRPGPGMNQRPPSMLTQTRSTIMVNRQLLEGGFYSIFFEYSIDFSDKRMMILRNISASLGMSIFSIIVVVVLFMITYRNLMEEKRLSNLKTDFINNMTHELKTPLATITVAGKTLEMEKIRSDDSKILETAKLIGKQSVHLNQLINMILEISMWERTQFELDKKTVDIEEVMNDIVESFKNGAGSIATIEQKYDMKNKKADIDVVYFTTLINNLLSNAVKYSDKSPVIRIEGTNLDNNICISVADNGIGISKVDQKHVFDKFYRASTGNIHKYKGLGLGLYYVKKIATAHGGDVTVSSKPGKGSIFTVTIPF